jgi:hypothetical protein
MTVVLVVYLVGVAIGLAVMRDRLPVRLVTALLWPLGPLAFCVVVPLMLVVAALLWPVPVLGGATILAAVAYLLGC